MINYKNYLLVVILLVQIVSITQHGVGIRQLVTLNFPCKLCFLTHLVSAHLEF